MISEELSEIYIKFPRHCPAEKHRLLDVRDVFTGEDGKFFTIPRVGNLKHEESTITTAEKEKIQITSLKVGQ